MSVHDEGPVADADPRALLEQLNLALEAGSLGTWRADLTTGRIVFDERLERIYGLAPGTFDGTVESWLAMVHPDDREQALATMSAGDPEERSFTIRLRIVWPDGTERWVDAWAQSFVDDAGQVVGNIGCARDATTEVTAQAAQEAQLARLQRVAEIERISRERVEFGIQINDALQSATSVAQIMRRVTRAAVPRLGDWCMIHVLPYEGATSAHVDAAHSDPRMIAAAERAADRMSYDLDATWGASAVIRTGEPEFFPYLNVNRIRGISDTARQLLMSMGLKSSIVVPIRSGDRIFGAITFLMTFGSRRYTEDDLLLAEAVAGRVATAIENLELTRHQVEIARVLQSSLLPSELPEIPNFEVSVCYTAAGEGTAVGGDFYDVFDLHGPAWGVAIGDVCGQGPQAAALTGLARHTIRTAAWRGESPDTVLARLNEAVYRSDTDSFCTAIFGVLDPTQRRWRAALGGHPLPILVDPDGVPRSVGRPGMLVGAFPVGRTTTLDLHLPPGSSLVLYTDGVTDIPPPDDLTPERWTEIVGRCARDASTAQDLTGLLDDAIDAIRPARARRDDIALLVLRSV